MSGREFDTGEGTTYRDDDSTQSLWQETQRSAALRAGMRLGSYDLKAFLGRGGFGEVWEAEDLRSGRRVALKVLTQLRMASREMIGRFKREGQLAASINHPRSVFVFGAEEISGHPAIAMELLSGGTLQDQLRLRERLPVEQSVDLILEVIEGLEAAYTAGVVHRDVKPSNCFIDEEGHAKIGDFGISKTLEAQEGFTSAEKFIGTPAFASPEQIRGREVDFRTDIYSVGATLYCILTGRPPFEGQNAGELLARILSEEPVPFAERRVDLPRGLDRVIVRCMAKEREKRYASYAELRENLLPFSSAHALTAGNLAMRFASFAVDEAALFLVFSASAHAFLPGWFALGVDAVSHLFYYGLFESLWRCTPGKRLMGLHVTAASGTPITSRQAVVRTMAFALILLPEALLELKAGPAPVLALATLLVYLSTMRRENGFAGPHELVSHTRVIATRKSDVPLMHVLQSDEWLSLRDDARPRRFGPYRALRNIWETESEALILAFDEVLKRQVWIRAVSNERSQQLNQLIAVRPGRLRWLQGERNGPVHWDAYEAPMGMSLMNWVRSRGGLPWSEARELLLGIVEELEVRLEAETAPVNGSLSHIWVDPRGRAKVLDFPASLDDGSASMYVDNLNARVFFQQVLFFSLTGRAIVNPKARPAVPLPEHARLFAERLWGSPGTFVPPSKIRSDLRRLLELPAEIGRRARARMTAAAAIIPVMLLLAPVVDALQTPEWQRDLRMVPAYNQGLRALDEYRGIPAMHDEVAAPCKLLAWIRREALAAPDGRARLSRLKSFERERMASCDRTYPSLAAEELKEARATVAKHIQPASIPARLQISANQVFRIGGLIWLIPVVLSFVFPPGPFARKLGFALQTTDGASASRRKCMLRALLVWLPFAVYIPVALIVGGNVFEGEGVWVAELLCGTLAIVGLAYSVARPRRGLPDLIAGTYLVPK